MGIATKELFGIGIWHVLCARNGGVCGPNLERMSQLIENVINENLSFKRFYLNYKETISINKF